MRHVPRRSQRFDSPGRRVETCCSRALPCATSWAYSLVRIDDFAQLIACSCRSCDACGVGGERRWWWPSQPPSTVGIARASIDAGAVGRDALEDRIDSECRGLIRRFAGEKHLWGAPRIHGKLLKLGIAVSERTVSRYLAERLRAPSHTWRTFLANPPRPVHVHIARDVTVRAGR
jgi:hypothetical protein